MIKYATASRVGSADPESILRHFTRVNVQHPTYQALAIQRILADKGWRRRLKLAERAP